MRTLPLIAACFVMLGGFLFAGDGVQNVIPDQADREAVDALIAKFSVEPAHEPVQKEVTDRGNKNWLVLLLGAVSLLTSAVLLRRYARSSGAAGQTSLKVTVGARLVGGASAIVLSLTCVAMYSLYEINTLGRELDMLSEEIVPLTHATMSIEAHQLQQAIYLERAFRYGEYADDHSKEEFAKAEAKFFKYAKMVDEEILSAREWLKLAPAHTEEEKAEIIAAVHRLTDIAAHHHTFDLLGEAALDLIHKGDKARARLLEEKVEAYEDELDAEIAAFLLHLEERTTDAIARAEHEKDLATNVLTVVSIVAIAFGFIISVLLTRSLTAPIRRIVAFAERVSGGDLTGSIELGRSDELGTLGSSLSRMSSRLRGTMSTLSQSAQSMSGTSETLFHTAEDLTNLAGNTTDQSASVGSAASESSATMRGMASTVETLSMGVGELADNASQAAQATEDAASSAEQSDGEIAQLAEAADKIGQILQTIEGIAEQTNLLALNATIEAARAGDVGKGFAVVASEVKELANQTSLATDDIRHRVAGIQGAAQSAVNAIKQITEQIHRANEYSRSIAASAGEQSSITRGLSDDITLAATATTEIADRIGTVSQAANETREGADRARSASRELSGFGDELRTVVSEFTV